MAGANGDNKPLAIEQEMKTEKMGVCEIIESKTGPEEVDMESMKPEFDELEERMFEDKEEIKEYSTTNLLERINYYKDQGKSEDFIKEFTKKT